jgi:hypothetical protein
MNTHTIPVSSPSKAGLQRSEVETFARKLEDRFRTIAEDVRSESVGATSASGRAEASLRLPMPQESVKTSRR